MKTILVAYDGSEHADRALDRAADLAAKVGAELVVISAAEPTQRSGGFAGTRDVDPADIEEVHESLAKAQSRLQEKSLTARLVEAHGDAADMIVQVANEKDADVIVVGHRGHNVAVRALIGSVSSKVVNHTERDVLVVH